MTDKDRLDRAIEFIRKIEKLDYPTNEISDIASIRGECQECGSEDVDVRIVGTAEVVDPKVIDDLKDEAWHVLVDIDGL